MYQFSRAIYLETHEYVSAPSDAQVTAAQRRVLTAYERIAERIAENPEHIQDPVRTLFNEIRCYFPIREQQRIFSIVQRYVKDAITMYYTLNKVGH